MWIKPGQLDLTYCTNIHAGESWDEVRASVAQYAVPLKNSCSPDAPFGLGLRLSAIAARQLLSGDRLQEFKQFLDEQDLYVGLINGFPFGSFHGERVKTRVFAPDFRDPARVRYTLDLAEILSHLLPECMDGGISTIPLSYKPWILQASPEGREAAWPGIVTHIVDVAERLVHLRQSKGRFIHLDIEAEPNGLVESTPELVDFFQGPLLSIGAPLLASRLGTSLEGAAQHLRDHIQVCFDVCHMAIQFEDVVHSISMLRSHGIGIGRLQISSALRLFMNGDATQREEIREGLKPLENGIYLHQVVERDADGALRRFVDLDEALSAPADGRPREWRIHFHVPLFTEEYGNALATQAENRSLLALAAAEDITHHLEIETYTWNVLPERLKTGLLASIDREFHWVLDQVCTKP